MAVDTGPAPAQNGVNAPGRARILQRTLRADNWLQAPLTTGGILGVFIVYSTIRIFMNDHFFVEQFHYLTPMYSPCISETCPPAARDFGTWVGEMPSFIPIAIFFFWILGGFRVTCYYYRKAGYRSLWFSPQACAVPEPHKKYTGETRFPLVFMNAHRYFFWLASILLLVNIYDAVKAFGGGDGFRFGLGTLIMCVNVAMLAGLHALVPRLPPRGRRPHQPLLEAPRALPAVDVGVQDQPVPRHVRDGVAVHRHLHGRLHHDPFHRRRRRRQHASRLVVR